MMGNRATFLRVGLLLVFGVAVAIALVLFLSRDQVRHGLHYETYSRESVQGLVVGAPVKFRGVSLGQVTEINLVGAVYPDSMPADQERESYQLVVIRFTVDPKKIGRVIDTAHAVELGLRARLATPGITGVVYIEIDFVDPHKFPAEKVPWKPEYDYIPSMPSTIAQVQDAAQSLLAKLQAVDIVRLSGSVQAVLDDVHAQLTEGGDLHGTLADAHTLLTTLRTAVEVADLPGLASDLRATSGSVRALVQSGQFKHLTASAADAADNFDEAAKRLPGLLDALATTVARVDNGVADMQQDLQPVLRDARTAVSNLRETTEVLRRYPSSVLLGAPPPHTAPR